MTLSLTSAMAFEPDKKKPVVIVSGFGAGGTTHLVASWFEQYLQSKGYVSIIDVKPGAKGQVSTVHFSQLPPDGQSVLLVLGLGMMVHVDPPLGSSKRYDYTDFEPVTILGKVPSYLVTKSENPIRTVDQLIAMPNKRISIGYGTETQEILAKTLAKTLGGDIVVVPYKNTGDVLRDLLGGNIEYAISTYTSSGPFIQQGKLVALATTASKTSVPEFNSTVNPLGRNFGAVVGIVLPKGSPKKVVDFYVNISKDFINAYREKFNEIQMIPADDQFGPAEFIKDMRTLDASTK